MSFYRPTLPNEPGTTQPSGGLQVIPFSAPKSPLDFRSRPFPAPKSARPCAETAREGLTASRSSGRPFWGTPVHLDAVR